MADKNSIQARFGTGSDLSPKLKGQLARGADGSHGLNASHKSYLAKEAAKGALTSKLKGQVVSTGKGAK